MCGRFVQLPLFSADQAPWPELADDLMKATAKYNLAPTQRAAVVLDEDGELAVRKMRWGLIAPWARELGKYATHNARIETVTTLKSYKDAWQKRRCLIPMAGWYEWQQLPDKTKQPYCIAAASGEQLYAAGLWEPRHRLQGEDEQGSCTMIVHDAIGTAGEVHDRMPVFLDPAQARAWMSVSGDAAMEMLLAAPVPEMRLTKVTKKVGNARNPGGPEFLQPVDEESGPLL